MLFVASSRVLWPIASFALVHHTLSSYLWTQEALNPWLAERNRANGALIYAPRL